MHWRADCVVWADSTEQKEQTTVLQYCPFEGHKSLPECREERATCVLSWWTNGPWVLMYSVQSEQPATWTIVILIFRKCFHDKCAKSPHRSVSHGPCGVFITGWHFICKTDKEHASVKKNKTLNKTKEIQIISHKDVRKMVWINLVNIIVSW